MANTAVYAGTKVHNMVFATCYSKAVQRGSTLRGLIDVQSLHPAGVSTNLTKFKEVRGEIATSENVARGSLADLGSNSRRIFGALLHSAMGHAMPLIAWSPYINKT